MHQFETVSPLQAKIEKWKRDLIDLTNRNVLLNFRPKNTNSVQVFDDPNELFEQLVKESKSFKANDLKTHCYQQIQRILSSNDEEDTKRKKIDDENQRFTKLLSKLRTTARTRMSEQGIHTLYLVFGTLQWRELNNDKDYFAPLLLVPVELSRQSANHPFMLRTVDEDIVLNPFLAHKLKEEKGILLPEFEDKEDLNILQFWADIEAQVCNIEGWTVVQAAYISLFSFSKLVMYKDFENYRDMLESHPLIRAISGEQGEEAAHLTDLSEIPDENTLDRAIPAQDSFQILDADSSQLQAIIAAKKGVSFVLQGPPGTGKSQTISNIIAEFLALNKKVLFVSEKMAALEVVKSRLENVGLGDFCLELHSHKANKRAVLDALNDVMSREPVRRNIDEQLYPRINNHRHDLNTYAIELHKVRQPLGKSVYEVHGLLAKLDSIPELMFEFEFSGDTDVMSLTNLLIELERFRGRTILVDGELAWKGFNRSMYSLELASKVEALLRNLLVNVTSLSDNAAETFELFGLKGNTIEELSKFAEIIETASYSPTPPPHWFTQESMKKVIEDAKAYQVRMVEFLGERKKLGTSFNGDVLELPLKHVTDALFKGCRDLYMTIGTNDAILLPNNRTQTDQALANGVMSVEHFLGLEKIAVSFGLETIKSVADIRTLQVYMQLLAENPRPTAKWFSQLDQVKNVAREAQQRIEHLNQSKVTLLGKYQLEVLHLDLFSIRRQLDAKSDAMLELFNPGENGGTSGDYIFTKRESILERLSKLHSLRELFDSTRTKIESIFGVEVSNIKSVRNLKPLVEKVLKDPRPQNDWFHVERQHEIYSLIQDAKNVHTKHAQELASVSEIYEDEVVDGAIVDIFNRFESNYQSFFRNFSGAYKRDRKWLSSKLKQKHKQDFDAMFKHVRSIKRVLEYRQWINDKQSDLRSTLGWHYKGHNTDWEAIEDSFVTVRDIIELSNSQTVHSALRDLLVNPGGQLEQLSSDFDRLVTLCEQIDGIARSLRAEFPDLFKAWHAMPIENWILTDVVNHGDDVLANLRGFYQTVDLVTAKRNHQALSPISLQDVFNDINLALEIIEEENSIQRQDTVYREFLGQWFAEEDTKWNSLSQAICDFEAIFTVSPEIPDKFQSLLLNDAHFDRNTLLDVKASISLLEESITYLSQQFTLLFEDMRKIPSDNWDLNHVFERFTWLNDRLNEWYTPYDLVSPSISKKFESFAEMKDGLQTALEVQKMKVNLDADLEELQYLFGDFFSGYSTDWQLIFDAVAWLEEWLGFFKNASVPSPLLKYVSEGAPKDAKQKLHEAAAKMQELVKENRAIVAELQSYFDVNATLVSDTCFEVSKFEVISRWTQYRLDSMELLEEWIRFLRVEKRLVDAKLGSFLETLIKERPEHCTFVDVFNKRFYRKWLDSVYQEEEILYEFEASKLNDKISDFRTSDLKSLEVNSKRIQQKLEENRKHALDSLTYRKELSVLLHEIGKKKRHMPIRKLLSQTEPLVHQVKPCMLMSPLSVSQFVDARKIHFDVVIFDEASQIFPEDAIGAIIRASQVIVVGDNKQLPPTDFFKAGGIAEEFEDEHDVEYESILDECMHVLPPMRLRWHYRSRHESLISFSNRAFYQNSLITFPSAENGEELGVKFVHVNDGTYDRGGTRSNKREAEVAAQLVFEHFAKYPKRSLGVIAFSDAQASAIREEIDSIRQLQPEMETYFREGHTEEFFVKSLENVQGDERDVIFFSVGYAKGPDGNLYANFGPLTKTGGERRLNVAVTRAKYHVKLISSLLPQEMPIQRTQSVGVHRLHDYMQMAMDGSLPTYTVPHKQVVFDSPFEEDVYNVLTDMGYEVETQVGSSGYRIDLAVVDPLKPDRYLLAIECDGKTYHSSKVARDRDRLRQQVLENLGWRIHRIWSQEWFKKRKFEVNRLKNLLTNVRYE